MRNTDTGLAHDILRAIQDDSQASPTAIADTTFTTPAVVSDAIAKWTKNDIVYVSDGNTYLTEKGRKQLGLYVRPKQAVA